jgi:hypothetical protein
MRNHPEKKALICGQFEKKIQPLPNFGSKKKKKRKKKEKKKTLNCTLHHHLC